MSLQVIPCDPALPFWTQTTTLDGVPYLLTFRYNIREDAYYLSISSADGATDYVLGMKLVVGTRTILLVDSAETVVVRKIIRVR